MVLVKELVTEFERFAPKELAMPKDPVGLQLGFLEQEVTKMMVTLLRETPFVYKHLQTM